MVGSTEVGTRVGIAVAVAVGSGVAVAALVAVAVCVAVEVATVVGPWVGRDVRACVGAGSVVGVGAIVFLFPRQAASRETTSRDSTIIRRRAGIERSFPPQIQASLYHSVRV